jgi:hypothetical protein
MYHLQLQNFTVFLRQRITGFLKAGISYTKPAGGAEFNRKIHIISQALVTIKQVF